MTKILARCFLAAFVVGLIAFTVPVQSNAQSNAKKKSFTLHGTIQEVKEPQKKVTVKHDKIEGYMGAMTMDYGVAEDAMLKKLKAGDEIAATVYENDYTLYDIRVVRIDDRIEPK